MAFPKLQGKTLAITKTIHLYLSFIALGLVNAIPGPALLVLQEIAHTDTEHIGFIYTARSSGFITGSVLTGLIYDRVKDTAPLLIFCDFIMAVTIMFYPWCNSLSSLIGLIFVGGISMGSLNAGVNSCCLDIWGEKAPPFYQALHFSFGLGGFIGPLILAPFLSNGIDSSSKHSGSNSTMPTKDNVLHNVLTATSQVRTAFYIAGAFTLLVTISFFLVFIFSDKSRNRPLAEKAHDNATIHLRITIAAITTIALGITTGMEVGYSQILATYAVKIHHLSKSVASLLTSAYWGSYVITRALLIYLAYQFKSVHLLVCDCFITIFTGLILFLLAKKFTFWLWVGTCLMGISLAPFTPTSISWVQRYIVITNKVAGAFVFCGSVAEMIIPATLGYYFKTAPDALLVFILAAGVVATILFSMLGVIFRHVNDRFVSQGSQEEEAIDAAEAVATSENKEAEAVPKVPETSSPEDETGEDIGHSDHESNEDQA